MHAKNSIRVLAAAGLMLATIGLAGCTSPFGGTVDPNALTLLAIDGGDDNAVLDEIVAKYEAQSDGIKVEVTYAPEETYVTKLQTAMLADSPDIANTYNTGLMFDFLPLNETVYEANDLPIDGFNAALPNFCGWDGTVYCVGTTVGNMVHF